MKNNIEVLRQNITKAEAFIAKWGDKLASSDRLGLSVSDYGLHIHAYKEDAALLGGVFGKGGWKRKIQGYGTPSFDWKKEVDGVKITINEAEDCDLNDSPVPEKAFPILLN